jgi:hypothetical protein
MAAKANPRNSLMAQASGRLSLRSRRRSLGRFRRIVSGSLLRLALSSCLAPRHRASALRASRCLLTRRVAASAGRPDAASGPGAVRPGVRAFRALQGRRSIARRVLREHGSGAGQDSRRKPNPRPAFCILIRFGSSPGTSRVLSRLVLSASAPARSYSRETEVSLRAIVIGVDCRSSADRNCQADRSSSPLDMANVISLAEDRPRCWFRSDFQKPRRSVSLLLTLGNQRKRIALTNAPTMVRSASTRRDRRS